MRMAKGIYDLCWKGILNIGNVVLNWQGMFIVDPFVGLVIIGILLTL